MILETPANAIAIPLRYIAILDRPQIARNAPSVPSVAADTARGRSHSQTLAVGTLGDVASVLTTDAISLDPGQVNPFVAGTRIGINYGSAIL